MVTWCGRCECEAGWGGERCARRQETSCQDEVDNDKGEQCINYYETSSASKCPLVMVLLLFTLPLLINGLKNG